jgi:general secretion pathway protein J
VSARRDRGVTLIELVAVTAIFALAAVMGLQALTGAMRAESRLTEIEAETAALARTLALLRRDLKSAVPVAFVRPDGAREGAFLHDPGAGRLGVSAAGLGALPGWRGAGRGRVVWRLDRGEGALTRRVWPALSPLDDGAAGAEVEMLSGVEGFEVRAFAGPEQGWVSGFGLGGERAKSSLPEAVEVGLSSQRHGPLRILVTY